LRLLLIHAEEFEYEAREKAIDSAEELDGVKGSARVTNSLVAFVTVEGCDGKGLEEVVGCAAREIADVAKRLNVNRVVVYPYAHLSPDLALPGVAVRALRRLAEELRGMGYEVTRAPFGWYKRFTLKCYGHPLAELSRAVRPGEGAKAEEYAIMTPEGKVYAVDEYDLSKAPPDFRRLVEKEALRKEAVGGKPRYLEYCRKYGIEWEPMSDLGHMRYGPEATLMVELISEYSWQCAKSLGIPLFKIRGTNIFDLGYPPIKQHASLFGERQYFMDSGDKKLVLRFASCYQQFTMIKDWQISYRNLPFGAFEVADSYRLEQPGELVLCFRMRRFHLPDLHIFTRDMDEAKRVSIMVHRKIYEEIRKLGKDYVSIYNITRSFLEEHRDFVAELVRLEGKPALLHFVPEGKYYWVLNIEYNIIDELGRPREIGTFQIDVGNARRFGIKYTDERGNERYPIIIHTALIGSIERYLYAVFDAAVQAEKRGEVPSLPLWLSPVQVRVIPYSKEYLEEAIKVADILESNKIRVDIDDRDETLAKKVRDAEMKWIPYIVVIGKREVEEGKLSVRVRERRSVEKKTVEELANEIRERVKGYPFKDLTLPRMLSARPGYR